MKGLRLVGVLCRTKNREKLNGKKNQLCGRCKQVHYISSRDQCLHRASKPAYDYLPSVVGVLTEHPNHHTIIYPDR